MSPKPNLQNKIYSKNLSLYSCSLNPNPSLSFIGDHLFLYFSLSFKKYSYVYTYICVYMHEYMCISLWHMCALYPVPFTGLSSCTFPCQLLCFFLLQPILSVLPFLFIFGLLTPSSLSSSSLFPEYSLPIQWLQLLPIVGSGAGSSGPHNCFSRLLVLTSCYICMWFHLWVSQVPHFPKCTYHHLISSCGNPSNFSVVPLLGAPSTMQSPEVLTRVWLWHVLCSQSSQSTAFLLILLPNSFFQIPPCLPITP